MRILTTSREVREITKAASFKSKPMLANFGEDYFWLKPKNAEKIVSYLREQNFPPFHLPRGRMKAEISGSFIQVTQTQC